MIGVYLTFIALNIACVLLMFKKDAEDYGRTLVDQVVYEYTSSHVIIKLCVAGIIFVPLSGVYIFLKYISEE